MFIPVWGNDPIWRACFSHGLKPPTSCSLDFAGCPLIRLVFPSLMALCYHAMNHMTTFKKVTLVRQTESFSTNFVGSCLTLSSKLASFWGPKNNPWEIQVHSSFLWTVQSLKFWVCEFEAAMQQLRVMTWCCRSSKWFFWWIFWRSLPSESWRWVSFSCPPKKSNWTHVIWSCCSITWGRTSSRAWFSGKVCRLMFVSVMNWQQNLEFFNPGNVKPGVC